MRNGAEQAFSPTNSQAIEMIKLSGAADRSEAVTQ
jgi:hypothetical protein